MSDESTLRKAVTTALVFLENAVVTKGAVALRDVAGARPLITSLRAALAAPSAATGSGDEADRLDALRAQRSVVTRNYARDPSNENEAALYAICERVYAAERARDEKGGE